MAVVIAEYNLAKRHETRWEFRYRGGHLHGGTSVLSVTDGSEWWEFECRSEGGNKYCICGGGWESFAQSRINAMITLYSKQEGEDFHRIRVRP